ncbi:hypothetical protein P7C70_g7506, partial [Phenoliferia sp. Uapishka_3]
MLASIALFRFLATSGQEENMDVAEILQNKLYYEADTLDMVLAVINGYSNQSIKYLDSVIHLSFVLLRMLEKYSKSKSYMYIRKKKSRAKKRKAKKDAGEDEGDGIGQGDEEEEEVDRGAISYGEHAFEFEKFEAQFAKEPTLATCMTYLEGYKDFKDPEQMKRIVSLMHRQAIKAKAEGLFFKPSVLELFQRILDDEAFGSAKDTGTTDLKKLIEYILKKFFKAVKENPMLLVEIFFPKTSSQIGKMRLGDVDPYASSEDDGPSMKAKMLGEVEVQPGFSLSQQIGIAIACIVDAGNGALIETVKSQLALAAASRHEIVFTTDGDMAAQDDEDDESDEAIRRKAGRLSGPSKEALALFTPHSVELSTDEEKNAGAKNAHFKLLLRLLKWESNEVPESQDLVWSIPTLLLPATLDSDIKLIDAFLLDPVDPNGKSAADLLRKKRKVPVRRRKEKELVDGLSGDEEDVPKKTKQKKRKEEIEAYKSAQFIDSDEDDDNEDRDAIFFAAERALREKLATGAVVSAAANGSKVAKNSKKAKTAAGKPAKEKKEKGKGRAKKVKPVKRTTFDTDLPSDLSDLDEDMAAAIGRAQGGGADSGTSTVASSGGGQRKRTLSVTSFTSTEGDRPPITATSREASDSEDSDAVGKATQAAKKRRVVVDSDDE